MPNWHPSEIQELEKSESDRPQRPALKAQGWRGPQLVLITRKLCLPHPRPPAWETGTDEWNAGGGREQMSHSLSNCWRVTADGDWNFISVKSHRLVQIRKKTSFSLEDLGLFFKFVFSVYETL